MNDLKETWTDDRGTVWRKSDDSGMPITVTKMSDPAYMLLVDGNETEPTVYRRGCYICEDPEFAQMGLPLCYRCQVCGGHIAADCTVCDECGLDAQSFGEAVCAGDPNLLVWLDKLNHYQQIEPDKPGLLRAIAAVAREIANKVEDCSDDD